MEAGSGCNSCQWQLCDARKFAEGIFVDQGLAAPFLANQLNPDVFEAARCAAGPPLTLRRHVGYEHGYYIISTVIVDHIPASRNNSASFRLMKRESNRYSKPSNPHALSNIFSISISLQP